MYKLGKGIEQDKAKAQIWFSKACEQGDKDSCAALSGIK